MNRLCQLSQSTRLDGVFSVLKVSDCALGNSGLARETFGKKLLRFLSGFDPGISDRPLFRIREKSHPPSLGLPLQLTSTDQPARPTRGRLFADGMKFTCHDVPTHEQANCFACTDAPVRVRSAELAFGSGQDAIDFVFHRPERQPARRFGQSR